MLDSPSADGDVEPDQPEPRVASVWPHAQVRPLDPAAITPAMLSANWPDAARAIIDRLDARPEARPLAATASGTATVPSRARAILGLKGADVVRASWDQDCASLFSWAGIDISRDAVLFSCTGADLIDALEDRPRARALFRERDGSSADALAAYVNRAALALLMGEVIGRFRHVLTWTRAQPGSAAPIVLHVPGCYSAGDTAGGATGNWLVPAFKAAAVPEVMRRALTAYVYDKLAAGLASLHEPAAGVYVLRWAGTTDSVVPMVAQMLARPR